MREYYVFGVGEEVRLRYSNEFIERITGFVDNDIEKQGKLFLGKEVFKPEVLVKGRAFVIVSSIYYWTAIRNQLEKMELELNKDFIWGPDWYGNEYIPSAYGYKQWKDYDTTISFATGKWNYRVQTIAECIDTNISSVLDLGAGAMSLKKYLPQGIAYYPADYCKRYPETILCDFERHEFPDKKVDCIVASGILEYISDLEWFIGEICEHCQVAVVSYIPIEVMRDFFIRQHEGWRNHYLLIQLTEMFRRNGFWPVEERICTGKDIIIKFKRG